MRSALSALMCWLLIVAAYASAAPADALFVLVADQHSAYDRTAQLVATVDQLKRDHPATPLAILIDGDCFEFGNVVAQRTGGTVDYAMFAALARRAPTVLNLGNHEAEFDTLANTVERIQATGVTVIGNQAAHGTGRLFAPASLELLLGPQRTVVVGFATDLLAQYRAAVRPSLELANPVVWARAHMPALLAPAPVKIVLSHAGLAYDRQILPLVPDGTLYVGAHDHLRFVHRIGRSVYVHSGSWNDHVSIVTLRHDAAGPVWDVEQRALDAKDPADPALTELIRQTRAHILTPADLAPVGRLPAALSREDAARFAVHALRVAAGADAAFIGNTTFGGGLPAGAISLLALDDSVRFDGFVCVAEASGEQLRAWLAAANQGPDTPFAERSVEFLFADGPSSIEPQRRYRIATTDWGKRNQGRYFGTEALVFSERPELRLKAIVAKALNAR